MLIFLVFVILLTLSLIISNFIFIPILTIAIKTPSLVEYVFIVLLALLCLYKLYCLITTQIFINKFNIRSLQGRVTFTKISILAFSHLWIFTKRISIIIFLTGFTLTIIYINHKIYY